MSHEISIKDNGQAEAFYAFKPAWHGLGQVVQECPTSEKAIKLAGLDWNVIQCPMRAFDRESSPQRSITVPNHYANCRSDNMNVLGVVTKRYQPVQNCEAFQFVDALVDDGEIRYESAGALHGGKAVWLLARMPGADFTVAADDRQEQFILFVNGHDGSKAVRVLPTTVRVVCQNTLNLALNGRTHRELRITHTGNISRKIDAARTVLGLVNEKVKGYTMTAKYLAGRKVTDNAFAQYVEAMFPERSDARVDTRREKAIECVRHNFFESAPQQVASIRRTGWAAFNAVTQYVDHTMGTRAKEGNRDEMRFASVTMGTGATLKERALRTASDAFLTRSQQADLDMVLS